MMFKTKMVKMLLVTVLALSALVTVSTTNYAATLNSESAYGIQYWGGFHASVGGQTVGIPLGQLARWISGKGYRV